MLLALCLATAGAAAAQTAFSPAAAAGSGGAPAPAAPPQGAPVDPNEVLVEELVVEARDGGPAWWKVRDGDSVVYVLGVPSVAPKGLEWDRRVFERRLRGASRVILPFNNVGVDALGAPRVLINLLRLRGRPAEERLEGPLRVRFIAARESIGQPASRYGYKNEIAVGILLVTDYRDHARLTAADPGKTIARLAKASGVKTVSRTYDLGPLMGAALRTSAAAQRACLLEALDEVETRGEGVRKAGEAWARGDVTDALGAERSYERCINAAPGALKVDARIKTDQADAIAEALKTPGHAIAVAPLRPLLARDGVLDLLRRRGFQVSTPGED